MLLTSDFYKQFSGDYLLIYQEDTIIFRDDSHLTYEGVSTLLNNFNKFLIDNKSTN